MASILGPDRTGLNTFLHGAQPRYRVIAPVAVVQLLNGSEAYIAHGMWIPVEVAPAHIEHLLSLGMIAPAQVTA